METGSDDGARGDYRRTAANDNLVNQRAFYVAVSRVRHRAPGPRRCSR